jgi:hypothetical protein
MYLSSSSNFEYSLFPPCPSFLLQTMKSSPSHTGVFHIKIKHQISISRLELNERFLQRHHTSFIVTYSTISVSSLTRCWSTFSVLIVQIKKPYHSFPTLTNAASLFGSAETDKSATYCTTQLTANRPQTALLNSQPIFEESQTSTNRVKNCRKKIMLVNPYRTNVENRVSS